MPPLRRPIAPTSARSPRWELQPLASLAIILPSELPRFKPEPLAVQLQIHASCTICYPRHLILALLSDLIDLLTGSSLMPT